MIVAVVALLALGVLAVIFSALALASRADDEAGRP